MKITHQLTILLMLVSFGCKGQSFPADLTFTTQWYCATNKFKPYDAGYGRLCDVTVKKDSVHIKSLMWNGINRNYRMESEWKEGYIFICNCEKGIRIKVNPVAKWIMITFWAAPNDNQYTELYHNYSPKTHYP